MENIILETIKVPLKDTFFLAEFVRAGVDPAQLSWNRSGASALHISSTWSCHGKWNLNSVWVVQEAHRKDGFGQIDRFVSDCLPVIPGQQIYFRGNLWDTTFSAIPRQKLDSSMYLWVMVRETSKFGEV